MQGDGADECTELRGICAGRASKAGRAFDGRPGSGGRALFLVMPLSGILHTKRALGNLVGL